MLRDVPLWQAAFVVLFSRRQLLVQLLNYVYFLHASHNREGTYHWFQINQPVHVGYTVSLLGPATFDIIEREEERRQRSR